MHLATAVLYFMIPFPHQNYVYMPVSPIQVKWPAHHNLLYSTILIIVCDLYKSPSSSLYIYLTHHVRGPCCTVLQNSGIQQPHYTLQQPRKSQFLKTTVRMNGSPDEIGTGYPSPKHKFRTLPLHPPVLQLDMNESWVV
jgi:hypothetical protein